VIDLDELQRLSEAATRGRWSHPTHPAPYTCVVSDNPETNVALLLRREDAVLIVAMRNSIDGLIAELRAERAKREEAERGREAAETCAEERRERAKRAELDLEAERMKECGFDVAAAAGKEPGK